MGIKLLATVTMALCFSHAHAIEVLRNYEERLGDPRALSSIDPDSPFGEVVDPASGVTVFSVPVLTIPGNGGLDISVAYKLGVRKIGLNTEWYFEQDEPHIGGSFSEAAGWTTSMDGGARCSMPSGVFRPPVVASSNGRPGWYEPSEYWSGYAFSLPGGNTSYLNRFDSSQTPTPPTQGGPYHWATNGHWYFSCAPLVVGAGEGFVGHSPNGLKYHFNKLQVWRDLLPLDKNNNNGQWLELYRQELRIYASKIEDRFGNYVAGLTASDGRVVTRAISGSTVTFTHGSQQWSVNTAPPFTVTYPDGSQWRATVSGSISDHPHAPECYDNWQPPPGGITTATITTRSGATGFFRFTQVPIGYSQVYGQCTPADNWEWVPSLLSWVPTTSLVEKTISGPGLASSTLNIDYGATNNCYIESSRFYPACTAESASTRTVTHSYSGGTYKRYTYGNRFGEDADLILKVEEGSVGDTPLRTTDYQYTLIPMVGSIVDSDYAVLYSPARLHRVIRVGQVIRENGRSFSWRVPLSCGASSAELCIDAFGRPTQVVRSSQPGT